MVQRPAYVMENKVKDSIEDREVSAAGKTNDDSSIARGKNT